MRERMALFRFLRFKMIESNIYKYEDQLINGNSHSISPFL